MDRALYGLRSATRGRPIDLAPLGFFELAWVGIPTALAGMMYLFFVAPRRLPAQDADLEEQYSLRDYLADLTLLPGSPLAGQTLSSSGLRRDHGLSVLAVRRGPGAAAQTIYAPGADFALQPGDTLVVEGRTERLLAGKERLGVISKPEQRLMREMQEAGELPGRLIRGPR